MFDGSKEDHSLELANLLRSGQFPSFDSPAHQGFRSLPPPLPKSNPPTTNSSNGRNSRLAFLDHLSASEDTASGQDHSLSSTHSSSTASIASHGSDNEALPALLNLGLVNQGFNPDQEDTDRETKDEREEENLKNEKEVKSNQNNHVKVSFLSSLTSYA